MDEEISFLTISDIHGDTKITKKLVDFFKNKKFDRPDAILIGGDIGRTAIPIPIPIRTESKKQYDNYLKNKSKLAEIVLKEHESQIRKEVRTQLVQENEIFVEVIPPELNTREDVKDFLQEPMKRTNFEKAREVLEILKALNLPIFAVIGNDNPIETEKILDKEGIKNIHCNPITFNNVSVLGYRGAPAAGVISYTNYQEEEAEQDLNKVKNRLEDPFIFVSHCPPYGILDFATYHGERHIGSRSIKDFINETNPAFCLCGHVHREGGGKRQLNKTLVANVACLARTKYRKMGKRFGILSVNATSNKVVFQFNKLTDNSQTTLT